MPQYNMPALITELIGGDIILVWQTSSGAVKTITGQDLADSLQALMEFNDTVTFVTSNLMLSNQQFVVANSGATFTITLPAAIDNEGRRYNIVNKGVGIVTIARSGTDTIGGVTSLTLAQYHGYTFESDGQGVWFVIATP